MMSKTRSEVSCYCCLPSPTPAVYSTHLSETFHVKPSLTSFVADEFLCDHLLSVADHKRASTEHFLSIVPSCHLVYN